MEFQEFVEKSQALEMTYHVSQEVYDAFQKCSSDMNPLHTDKDFAKRKGFPECVMYGNILNAFVSHFVGMALPSPDVMIQTQDIQFRKPVWLGNEITIKASPDTVSDAVQIVNFKLKFYRTNVEKSEPVATGHVQIGMLHDK